VRLQFTQDLDHHFWVLFCCSVRLVPAKNTRLLSTLLSRCHFICKVAGIHTENSPDICRTTQLDRLLETSTCNNCTCTSINTPKCYQQLHSEQTLFDSHLPSLIYTLLSSPQQHIVRFFYINISTFSFSLYSVSTNRKEIDELGWCQDILCSCSRC
jgi:hypothetical protein